MSVVVCQSATKILLTAHASSEKHVTCDVATTLVVPPCYVATQQLLWLWLQERDGLLALCMTYSLQHSEGAETKRNGRRV